jgi:hypothetical protein
MYCSYRIQLQRKLNLSTFIFQSDNLCEAAEKSDTEKLRSNLNANLAKLCHEMPQLFARIAEKYPTSEEALDQVQTLSDRAFSESAEDEIGRVRGVLAYHLKQLTFFIYQIQGEFEEGVEHVIMSEKQEAEKIIKLKLQELQVAQEVEEAIKASEAQFV